jgi:large subunit ribosomal protein L23
MAKAPKNPTPENRTSASPAAAGAKSGADKPAGKTGTKRGAKRPAKPAGATDAKHNPAQFYALVRRPIVTEKSTAMQAMRNQFTFEVARSANKIEVKKAIETLFSVKVVKVNIAGVPSKTKRTFGRQGETKPWKKAFVTLREGDSIDIS